MTENGVPPGAPREGARFLPRFLRGYRRLFSLLAVFLILTGLCLVLALLLVYPLWHFSQSSPEAYTVLVLALFGVFAVYMLFHRLRRVPVKRLLSLVLHILLWTAALTAFVFLVCAQHKRVAFGLIPASLLLHGLLGYGKK